MPRRPLLGAASASRSRLAAACAAIALAACGAPQAPDAADARAADDVYAGLIGAFDSSAQAAADDAYYDISLVMCPADAPELGARVLYVEQAIAATPAEPYRQRVYVVEPAPGNTGAVETTVYAMVEPDRWIGACDGVPQVGPDDLELREGCGVTLTRTDAGFEGATDAQSCGSTLRGASYATSEVVLTPAGLTSWDRGFDADGEQVWGAEAGPYVFERRATP